MNREEFIKEMKQGYRLEPGVYGKILDASMKSRNWTEQSMIIMEELAELSQQVSKGARGEHDPYDLILEMADVVACLDMLMTHYEITEEELERALAVKSVYIGKKLGLIDGEKNGLELDIQDLEFNIGDKVITVDGDEGHIVDICKCDQCEKRGFYEPEWENERTCEINNITVYEARNGFKGYHKIGKYTFHALEKKEPEFEYPSESLMITRLRVFCGAHTMCGACPLYDEFCRHHKNTLGFRFMTSKVSTADLYRMYRAMMESKEKK